MGSEMKNNIEQVVRSSLCTGCGICASMCPRNAIHLNFDKIIGKYVPWVFFEDCNYCGICYKICPGHSVDFIDLNSKFIAQGQNNTLLGNYICCYTGYINNYNIRYRSSSGGLLTAFLIYALEQKIVDGAIVTRMKKDNPLEPETFIARTKEELLSAMGSKYCPVPVGVAIREILETEGRYAVVGLPCHMHGIRKAEVFNKQLRERIALHVGIICGTTKTFLGTEFQLKRLNIKEDSVQRIEYRGNGWPGNMTIYLKDDHEKIQLQYPFYYDCVLSSFTPRRCMLCIDQSNELSDVCFGDAWIEEIKQKDNIGTSIVISRNDRCDKILNEMANCGCIDLQACDPSQVIRSQGYFERKTHFQGRKRLISLIGISSPKYGYLKPQYHYKLKDGISDTIIFSKIALAASKLHWNALTIYCYILKFAISCYKKIF